MKTLIWDLPTRLFHWAFAGTLTTSIVIALAVDEHHPLFRFHMLFGIAAGFLLAMRGVLGLIGSRFARFGSFPLNPIEFARYVAQVVAGKARRYAGHNPGSAAAAVAMFLLVPALLVTGAGMGGEDLEDLHGALAYTLMAVIGAHLAGLVAYTIRHRENIAASMITGRKDADPADGIVSARPIMATAGAALAALWITLLFTSHDPRSATTRLPGIGLEVRLGESGTGHDSGSRHSEKRNKGSRHEDSD